MLFHTWICLQNALSDHFFEFFKWRKRIRLATAGVQPWWIQGDSKVGGTASASLEKYIFNYKYIERLEMDSVVEKLVEKKRLNNLVYMEQHPCSRWEFSQKIGEQERMTWGYQSFWKLIRFFILGFAYIPFVTYRDEYRVTQGSAVLIFIKIRCFT